MKTIAKSLLNKTSKPKTKIPKSKAKKSEYKFSKGDTVYYTGISYEDYQNQECVITNKSRQHIDEYYEIEFNDGLKVQVPRDTLRGKDEFELELGQENDKEEVIDVSEVERKILEAGLIPMKNQKSCHNQDKFYHRACGECDKEPVCIYEKKYKYDKVKYN